MAESTESFDRVKCHSKLSQLLDMIVCKPKKVSEHADTLESDSDVVEAILSELVSMLAAKLIQRHLLLIYMCINWSSFPTRRNVKLDF